MAIGDDWTIDYVNKKIYHSANTTVYTANQLYSYLQDVFDELVQMDDKVPMSAQTPTEYTMTNGWWLDIGDSGGTNYSHRYLRGGAIATIGYDASTFNDGIRLLKFIVSGYVSPILASIGQEVGYSGGAPTDTATLIGYDNTLRYWWVRVNSTSDTFQNTATALDINDGGGTGAGTLTDPSITGEELFANIYTLGTIADDPYAQVYAYQAAEPIAEWSSLTNWDRGQIDVLIQVKEMGYEIDGANVTVFARQEGDLYDNFDIDLSSGGRNAVPLATATDLDNDDTGSYYLLYDGETGGGFAIGDIITGVSSGSVAEIIAITDWGVQGVLTLTSATGDFNDNENLQVSATTRGVANGTAAGNALGDTYITFDSQTVNFTNGHVILGGVTGAKRVLVGQQDDGADGKLVLKVDPAAASSQADYYIPYSSGEALTDEGTGDGTTTAVSTGTVASYSDIKIYFVNLDLDYDAESGGFVVGDLVTGATSGATGRVLYVDDQGTYGTITLGNVTKGTGYFENDENLQVATVTKGVANGTGEIIHTLNKTYEQGSPYPYDAIIDMNSQSLAEGHKVTRLYEYCKLVNRWDSAYSMYKVQRLYPHVFKRYDTSGATFTDDLDAFIDTTADDVEILDADPEAGDYILIGWNEPFNKLRFNLTTQGSGTWTLDWEYWNNSTWVDLNWQGVDGVGVSTANADQFTAATGWHEIYWDMPTNWTANVMDDDVSERYYIRINVESYTSTTTAPLLGQGWLNAIYIPENGEEYITAYTGYALKKASPLGTFAGGTFFGAQGVWIENMHSDDVQSYSLIDSNGQTRNPPNKQPLTVTSVVAGDRITIFRTTGASAGGPINKAMYTSTHTDNTKIDSTFVIDGTISVDTPSTGVIRLVDTSTNKEHRIRYASWSSATFTLNTEITSLTDDPGTATRLYDINANFNSANVRVGDLIFNSTDDSWAHVATIDMNSGAYLDTTVLYGGGDNTWQSGDQYALHILPVDYTSNDTVYVPFIDLTATATSTSVTVIYTTNRFVLTRVRKKGIIPFEIAGEYITTGYSVAAIRTPDTIVS